MGRIVVAGSENGGANNPITVAVVDASNPAAATVTPLPPNIGQTGAHIALGGTLLAAGALETGEVGIFDVTKPTAPQSTGAVNSGLSGGVGVLAVRGTLVVAGEWTSNSGARVVLIDASPNPPKVLGTATTKFTGNTTLVGGNPQYLPAIGSVAFLSDRKIVATSPADDELGFVDFTILASPVVTYKATAFAGIGASDADADAQRIVAADGSTGRLQLYDAMGATIGTPQNTMLSGVNSVSFSAPLAVGGCNLDPYAGFVDFGAPSATKFPTQLSGEATAAIHGTFIALGSINGPFGTSAGRIQFFDASDLTAPLGHADVNLASISTLSISETVDMTASPSSVDFGVVPAGGVATQSITVKNAGTIARKITAITITAPVGGAFMVKTPPTPALPISVPAGGTKPITIQFTGGMAVGNASASLKLSTDDPTLPNGIPISLTGTVGAAQAAFSLQKLDFGNVAVCSFEDLTVTLLNNGNLPLMVTAVDFGAEPRLSLTSPLPLPLTVPPALSKTLTVRFKPNNVLGAIANGIKLDLTSNANVAPVLPISGTAVAAPAFLAFSPAALNFGNIPVNSVGALSLSVSNQSQCNALNVTLTTAAPFSVEGDPTSGFTFTGTLMRMVTVQPQSTANFAIAFAPVAAGAFAGQVAIVSNDPNPARAMVNIPLNGSAVLPTPTALELILDQSGSMSDPVAGGTKMDSLHQTVALFATLVPTGNGDECGAVRFDSAASVLTPRAVWNTGQQAALTAAVNALQPNTSTSIGAGLQAGLTDLTGSALPRRAMLVFTDGMENTAPMIATVLPTITTAGIEVYSIGLGRPTDISTAALMALAVNSNGKFFSTDDALVLRKQFLQVLADAFRQNVAADPIVTITANTKASLVVNLNSCDRAVTFAASWDDPGSYLVIRLIAPNGTVFTPSSTNNRLVQYGQGSTYAWYRVRFAPLDPGSGQFLNPAPAGAWRLEVSPSALSGASERIAMSVLVDSGLTLNTMVRASNVGSPVFIEAGLFDAGNAVTGAKVEARVTAPAASLAASMTPAVVAQALAADQHIRPLRPSKALKSSLVPLRYAPESGLYTARLAAPRIDGLYQIDILASGPACNGQFNRYATQTVYVAPKTRGSGTKVTVTPVGIGGGIVVVTPVNSTNKPLGTGNGHLIAVTVSGKGSSASPTIDLGNGHYTFKVWWNPRVKKPTITVSVAGTKKTVSLVKKRRST